MRRKDEEELTSDQPPLTQRRPRRDINDADDEEGSQEEDADAISVESESERPFSRSLLTWGEEDLNNPPAPTQRKDEGDLTSDPPPPTQPRPRREINTDDDDDEGSQEKESVDAINGEGEPGLLFTRNLL